MFRIGIIGFGSRISNIISHATESGRCILVAVADKQCDVVSAKHSAEFPDVKYYDDAETMLKTEKLDGVFIGTRCNIHTELAVLVAKYNIPMFLEKPVSINEEQLEQLKTIMHMNDKTVVSFPLRMCKIMRKVKELVDSGVIGQISQVQAYNNVPYGRGYFHKWYRDESITGGLFLQKSTHDLDYINYILGDTAKVKRIAATESKLIFKGDKSANLRCSECEERNECPESDINVVKLDTKNIPGEYCCFAVDTGNHDCGSIFVEYENGLHTVYTQNFVARKAAEKRGARFIGYNGTLEFDFYTEKILIYNHFDDEIKIITIDSSNDGGHFGGDKVLVENFMDIMEGKAVSKSNLREGILSAEMCVMAKKSATEHVFVEKK